MLYDLLIFFTCLLYCLQDVTDFEWEFWISAIKSLMPAMLVHMLGGLFFSRFIPQVKCERALFFSWIYSISWKWNLIFTQSSSNFPDEKATSWNFSSFCNFISVISGKLNKKEWEGLRIDKISTDVLIMNFKRKFA